jgi:hypothetical protein
MDTITDTTDTTGMVPVVLDGPVEHVGADQLLEQALELVARLRIMATSSALPGDEAVAWLEHRAECMDVVSSIAVGLVTMAVPE